MTHEEIYNNLLNKIIELEYMPGDGISENELCEIYGTTRHAIRGVLAILKEKGLIEVKPQRGTYVSLIDIKLIEDVLFLREAVEQATIHEIMKKTDNSALVKKLRECIDKQRLAAGDINADFYKLDDEFHEILLGEIGRLSVKELYKDKMLHMKRWRNIEVSAMKRRGSLPEEHKAIIDAIEAKDENQARKLMGVHINSAKNFGEEVIKKLPQYFN